MGLAQFVRDTFSRETRVAGDWGTEHIIPRSWSQYVSDAGVPVTEADAYGIPAVSNVIRSPAEIIAALPCFVYQNGDVRSAARTSWQWSLLHDQPSEYCSSFEFFYDLEISLEATQNAFIRKVRGIGSRRGRLEELYVLDPHRMSVSVDKQTGDKTFKYWLERGDPVTLSASDILHIRGFTPIPGGAVGVSLIEVHRNTLGSQRAMQSFEGDYFRAGGIPPFWFTGASNPVHAKEIVDSYSANRTRARSGDPGALWGTIDVKHLPISMTDAAYVDNKAMSVEDACRIWRWPKEWVEAPSEGQMGDTHQRTAELIKLYVYPRLRRIERAFAADPDLFGASNLYAEFLAAALERADFVTRVRGYKDARQGGWITANEIRQLENLPPREEGDELQVTPVGGAPNPSNGGDSDEGADVVRALLERIERRDAQPSPVPQLHIYTPEPTPQEPPTISVNVPEQPVNVNLPELRPEFTLHERELPAPVVNVTLPELEAPVVNVNQPDVIVNVPEQRAPDVNFAPEIRLEEREQLAPIVNVQVPEQAAPVVQVDVQVPEQPAPVVNVEVAAAEQLPPIVNVEPPVVNVENVIATPDRKVTFKRGPRGEIKGATIEDE